MIHPQVDLFLKILLSRYSVAGRMIGDSGRRRYFWYWSCSERFWAWRRTCSSLPPPERPGWWWDSARRQVWQRKLSLAASWSGIWIFLQPAVLQSEGDGGSVLGAVGLLLLLGGGHDGWVTGSAHWPHSLSGNDKWDTESVFFTPVRVTLKTSQPQNVSVVL